MGTFAHKIVDCFSSGKKYILRHGGRKQRGKELHNIQADLKAERTGAFSVLGGKAKNQEQQKKRWKERNQLDNGMCFFRQNRICMFHGDSTPFYDKTIVYAINDSNILLCIIASGKKICKQYIDRHWFFCYNVLIKLRSERLVHKMHITLTGNLGSGKSTLSKILEAEYGYEIFSTGKVIRKIAEEHGLSVLEMNELMNKDPKYDHEIDDTTARISRENPDKSILFDSRLAWHFVDKSFKVFLSVSLDVAAQRVAGDVSRGEVEHYASLEDAKANLKKRAETEDTRYKELYNIEYFNYSNYNLVLDSTDCAPDILAMILKDEAEAYEKAEKEGKGGYSRLILSLNRPEEDFAKEKAAGVVTRETLHGVEFTVITLQ